MSETQKVPSLKGNEEYQTQDWYINTK